MCGNFPCLNVLESAYGLLALPEGVNRLVCQDTYKTVHIYRCSWHTLSIILLSLASPGLKLNHTLRLSQTGQACISCNANKYEDARTVNSGAPNYGVRGK